MAASIGLQAGLPAGPALPRHGSVYGSLGPARDTRLLSLQTSLFSAGMILPPQYVILTWRRALRSAVHFNRVFTAPFYNASVWRAGHGDAKWEWSPLLPLSLHAL